MIIRNVKEIVQDDGNTACVLADGKTTIYLTAGAATMGVTAKDDEVVLWIEI